ncbi:uncharacterized protein LOC106165600 [Lingula anatina]|uniref:Uncharacterized protein LOC106165600 n=1 Tax=Lingula anatina TaxID=7574 RepID=A0A1S3IM80_LINAN|nr:uncharacterized protein LOC106165600 [Lingula anatina]|eukprot:XP_013399307.1 uncharacterized protein LOC106165600 [Lingula anatina]
MGVETMLPVLVALVTVSSAAFHFSIPDRCGDDVSHSQIMKRSSVRAQSFCALECAQEPSCFGFNWQREPDNGVHLCELVNSTSDEYGKFLIATEGFSYVEKSESGFQSSRTTCSKGRCGRVDQFVWHDAYNYNGDNQIYVHSSKRNATLSYTNWALGEPNLVSELCVGFKPDSGQWCDVPCSWDVVQTICEIDQSGLGCRCPEI